MTREQLDLLMLFLALAGGLLGLPLAGLQLIETALDVREKWTRLRRKRPRSRHVNPRRKNSEVA